MAKKYLSIEEAARILGLDPKELNRLREKGDVRAFADRGTWKFRQDEIEELSRTMHADSDPEVPIGDYGTAPGQKETVFYDEQLGSAGGSGIAFGEDEASLSDQPTIVRRGAPEGNSDSDVRLILEDTPSSISKGRGPSKTDKDSDSDVRLTPDVDEPASDSDVKMIEAESQSDIRLIDDPDDGAGSDSDVQLVGNKPTAAKPSDSSVRLVSGGSGSDLKRKKTGYDERDSDVTLFKPTAPKSKAGGSSMSGAKSAKAAPPPDDDDAFSLDLIPTAEDGSFILGREDSGISLTGPSDSGIGLHAGDSGIELDDADSGITLDAGESGISLESSGIRDAGDSGIALESDDSGITLESDESGITLDAGGSGISLEAGDSGIALDDGSDISLASDSSYALNAGDSGIALQPSEAGTKKPTKPAAGKGAKAGKKKGDEEDDLGGTIPMMPTFEAEEDDLLDTQMEVPMFGEDDGGTFEFASNTLDDSEHTADVITLGDEEGADDYAPTMIKRGSTADEEDLLEDAVFDMDDDGASSEQFSVSDDVIGEDDELEEMEDVFGAADEDFDEGLQSGESHTDFVAPVARMAAPVEAEWGTMVFSLLLVSTILMAVTGGVGYDLVRTMWNGNDLSGPTGSVVSALRGIFG